MALPMRTPREVIDRGDHERRIAGEETAASVGLARPVPWEEFVAAGLAVFGPHEDAMLAGEWRLARSVS